MIELSKELKDAGFGDGSHGFLDGTGIPVISGLSLKELISALGEDFGCLITLGDKYIVYPRFQITDDTEWYADYYVGRSHTGNMEQEGSTPEEAVARLLLELNKKP